MNQLKPLGNSLKKSLMHNNKTSNRTEVFKLMFSKHQQWAFLILCGFLLAIAACTRACKSRATDRSTINIDISAAVESLDSRYATSAFASRISELVYASLFEIGDDGFPKPFLAKTIEALDDKTFKLVLQANLKFHDNSNLSAHDVVYTFTSLDTADVSSPYAERLKYIETVKAINDHEIIFELKRPHAPFLVDLCAIGIVSKKACKNRSQKCRHEHVGSGPFMVKKWDTAKESIHFTPFEDWFEGAPKDDLLFRVVRDENTRLLEMIGKKADLIESDLSPGNTPLLKKYKHLEIIEVGGLSYTYLAINVRGPKPDDQKNSPKYLTRKALANKQVRKAIAHAIDFDQIVEKLLLNTADRSTGLIPNGHWAKGVYLKPLKYDPKLAQIELDQAGYKRKKEDNMRFSLTISVTPSRLRQSCAQLYADFLKRVGIDAKIRIKDWSALYQDMKQGNFEVFSAIWPVIDPDLYHFVHHSKNIPNDKKGGGNRHGYKNQEIDHLIEMGRTTMEPEKRKLIYQEIERILLEDLPYIPLWHEHRIVVVNKERVKGFKPSKAGSLLGLRKAYLATNQTKKAVH